MARYNNNMGVGTTRGGGGKTAKKLSFHSSTRSFLCSFKHYVLYHFNFSRINKKGV